MSDQLQKLGGLMKVIDLPKKEIHALAESLIVDLNETGDFDLEMYARIRQIKEYIDKLEKGLKDMAYYEVSDRNETSFREGHVEMTLTQRANINYAFEDDQVYKDLQRKLKDRESILKLVADGNEQITGVPKVKKTGSKVGMLRVSLK